MRKFSNLGEEDGDIQDVDAVDVEFACKAGTSMFKDACALVSYPRSGIKYAMVIGADNSQAAPRGCPGGELDQFVGYGGAAFIFGKQDVIAEVEGWYSCTSDTPDFWRRDGEPFPMHGGRFTGDPAYFKHVRKAASKLWNAFSLKPTDINYFAPHQPNPSFPVKSQRSSVLKKISFVPALLINKFGNTYSGCTPVGLGATLDIAKPNELIFVLSYGSGAGSDAYLASDHKPTLG